VLAIAAEAALLFLGVNNPSLVLDCQVSAGSSNVGQDTTTE